MPPIGMPAWKQTADSIWNSFRSSGKTHLLLTGSRGAGKSTLLRTLMPEDLPGITTHAVPGEAVFLCENGTNREARIGFFDPSIPGETNRMRPDPAGFAALGIPALHRCMASFSPWIMLDEIGYLETAAYCEALTQLLEKKQVIAAVRKQDHPFLTGLLAREDAFVIDLDAPCGNTGCVIMASGLGKRFGSNKLMADFRGEPLIAGCLAATADIPHRVVVTRHPSVAAYCRERLIPVVLHDLPDRSDTVRLGLEALPPVVQCIFCQGDQPLLRAETVQALAMWGLQNSECILRAAADGKPGAPILFPGRYFDQLRELPAGKGGSYLAKKYPEQVRLLPVRDSYELMDVDTPEDLANLAER